MTITLLRRTLTGFFALAAVSVMLHAQIPNVLPMSSGGAGGPLGTFAKRTLTINGRVREFRLVVPPSINRQEPVPLVFAFHGLFDSKDLMPLYTFLDFLAYEKRFILVYPNGTGHMWPLLPQWAADDLAFYDAMYADITKNYNIDLNRVYLTGMSMGAAFTHILAMQRSEQIAAIAPHSGSLGFMQFADPKVPNKFGVFVVHGAIDPVVNVREGRKTRDLYQQWGHPVEYVEVPTLNHFWAFYVDINHKIWNFFMQHPRTGR